MRMSGHLSVQSGKSIHEPTMKYISRTSRGTVFREPIEVYRASCPSSILFRCWILARQKFGQFASQIRNEGVKGEAMSTHWSQQCQTDFESTKLEADYNQLYWNNLNVSSDGQELWSSQGDKYSMVHAECRYELLVICATDLMSFCSRDELIWTKRI